MQEWLLTEVGGSSIQTAQRDGSGRFWFTPGLVRETDRPIALACPGLIRGGSVLYATNLGWPDRADPREELGLPTISLVENDVVAASLGESLLRSTTRPERDLFYVSLGTRITSREIVPAGRIFFHFLLLLTKSLPSSPVASSHVSDDEKSPALCARTGTISREAAMFAPHWLA